MYLAPTPLNPKPHPWGAQGSNAYCRCGFAFQDILAQLATSAVARARSFVLMKMPQCQEERKPKLSKVVMQVTILDWRPLVG